MPWEWGGTPVHGGLASAARSQPRSPRPGEAGTLGPRRSASARRAKGGGTRSEAEEKSRLEGGGHVRPPEFKSRSSLSGDCSKPRLLHRYMGLPMSLGS